MSEVFLDQHCVVEGTKVLERAATYIVVYHFVARAGQTMSKLHLIYCTNIIIQHRPPLGLDEIEKFINL